MLYEFRNYLPHLGHWMTRDPLGEAGGLNLYAFVGNNPVNWGEPWGEARKGERGRTGKPSGTGNEFKHYKPHPTDPGKVIFKDPDGKQIVKPKPVGFDEYWEDKHPSPKKPEDESNEDNNNSNQCSVQNIPIPYGPEIPVIMTGVTFAGAVYIMMQQAGGHGGCLVSSCLTYDDFN